jgi:hypothetical protein
MATDTGLPYTIPFPVPNDVADVPAHMKGLAERLELVLDQKTQDTPWTASDGVTYHPGNAALYQAKIRIQSTIPAATAPGNDGDIIFVVQ